MQPEKRRGLKGLKIDIEVHCIYFQTAAFLSESNNCYAISSHLLALVSTVPLFLCIHCSSVPTVPLCPLFLCFHCSSASTVPLCPLFLCVHCSSVSMFLCAHRSSVSTVPLRLLPPLCPLFLCAHCSSVSTVPLRSLSMGIINYII